MIRALLLSCSLATFAACDVGTIPEAATPDGPGVLCEPAGVNPDGNHRAGEDCMQAGACHSTAGATPVLMKMGGTAFETAQAATGLGSATILVEWGDPVQVAKFVTASDPPGAEGNFFVADLDWPQVTYPATVKISLCPDPEKAMATKIMNESEMACSKGGCHGNGTLKIYLK